MIFWFICDRLDCELKSVSTTIPDDFLISNGTPTWSEDYVEIPADLNCSANQFITVKDHKMVCGEPHYTTEIVQTTIIKEVPMWTVSNILVVAIIAMVVYNMMPKLTMRNFFKVVWKLIIRPFQRKEKDISEAWKTAEEETKEGE